MEYSNYMDMFKSGANNTPETLTAVGGGAKYPNLQGFLSEVLK